MNQGAPFSFDEILFIARGIADALAAIHDTGAKHLGVNPNNAFLMKDGQPMLADFGLSQQHQIASGMMSPNTIMRLAPHYISPEQIKSLRTVDHRTDQYSFGALLYKLVTGKAPFAADSTVKLIQAVVSEDPISPDKLRTDTPAALTAIVMRLLSKDPTARYEQTTDLCLALNQV